MIFQDLTPDADACDPRCVQSFSLCLLEQVGKEDLYLVGEPMTIQTMPRFADRNSKVLEEKKPLPGLLWSVVTKIGPGLLKLLKKRKRYSD